MKVRTVVCRLHIPGFQRGMKEEIQICSFGWQMTLV